MNRTVLVMSLVASMALTSCATPYQKNNNSGGLIGLITSGGRVEGGFSETQLSDNVFNVTFAGNSNTSRERATDFTLLRSADITMNNGYRYFVIIDASSEVVTSTYTTPTTYQTTGNVSGSGQLNATTRGYGGETYEYTKPSASNTIVCFHEKPTKGVPYEAIYLWKSITKKYDLSP